MYILPVWGKLNTLEIACILHNAGSEEKEKDEDDEKEEEEEEEEEEDRKHHQDRYFITYFSAWYLARKF